jgi:hypothetical protein
MPSYGHPYFTEVRGTWTVPLVDCAARRGASSSTVWVGIGGYLTKDQEEVGTDSNCTSHGKPRYYAWFEVVPYRSYQAFPTIKDTVAPGDTVSGVVRILSPTLVQLRIADLTRQWSFMRKITYTSQDTSTADWVVEAPAECVVYSCHEASLADFRQVTMRNIHAVAHGEGGALNDSHWKVLRVRLIPSRLVVPTLTLDPTPSGPVKTGRAVSPAGAVPGRASRNGSSFDVKWIPVARHQL